MHITAREREKERPEYSQTEFGWDGESTDEMSFQKEKYAPWAGCNF